MIGYSLTDLERRGQGLLSLNGLGVVQSLSEIIDPFGIALHPESDDHYCRCDQDVQDKTRDRDHRKYPVLMGLLGQLGELDPLILSEQLDPVHEAGSRVNESLYL